MSEAATWCFGSCRTVCASVVGDVRRRHDQNGDEETEENSLRGPSWFRWAPTSELELYKAEQAILGPIRPMICQRTVAGLNTIATVHPKVGRDGVTPVRMVTAVPVGHQQEEQRPLDADNYTSIVFVHGYAGGVANWLPIWKDFAADNDVYAYDLPGFARSVRPAGRPFNSPQDAINWYVGHFEQWFEAMQLGVEYNTRTCACSKKGDAPSTPRPAGRRIVLVGHSFGGYLCSQFAMRHPEIVDHLVLVDAWGVHRHVPPTPEEAAAKSAGQSYASKALNWAMDGIYWSKLLRSMGPAARSIFAKARPEFMDTWSPFLKDPQHFYDYTYHCNAQHPHTGERAFARIRCPESGPFGARLPLFVFRARLPRTLRSEEEATALMMERSPITCNNTNNKNTPHHVCCAGSGPTTRPYSLICRNDKHLMSGPSCDPSTSSYTNSTSSPAPSASSSMGITVSSLALSSSVTSSITAQHHTTCNAAKGCTAVPTAATATLHAAVHIASSAAASGHGNEMLPSSDEDDRESAQRRPLCCENDSEKKSAYAQRKGGLATSDEGSGDGGRLESNDALSTSDIVTTVDGRGAPHAWPVVVSPYPLHARPRLNFKLTMLYGDQSWLRSEDTEALAPLLVAEHRTDATYTVISKAGHMVMVDNARDFTAALKERLA